MKQREELQEIREYLSSNDPDLVSIGIELISKMKIPDKVHYLRSTGFVKIWDRVWKKVYEHESVDPNSYNTYNSSSSEHFVIDRRSIENFAEMITKQMKL